MRGLLQFGVDHDREEMAKLLLSLRAELKDVVDRAGKTALHDVFGRNIQNSRVYYCMCICSSG